MNLTSDIYQRIVAAKVYIDENYHEPIDLDQISLQAFLSRFHFHRIFRQVYRYTPHQYLTRKRIEKAKDLLAENKPITEVCNEVGFEEDVNKALKFLLEKGVMGAGAMYTSDCRATYEELKAKGVVFKSEPKEQFCGIEAIITDGCGNWFSMTQPKEM